MKIVYEIEWKHGEEVGGRTFGAGQPYACSVGEPKRYKGAHISLVFFTTAESNTVQFDGDLDTIRESLKDALDALNTLDDAWREEFTKNVPDVSTPTGSSEVPVNGYDQKSQNEADHVLLAILRGEREDHDESFLHVDLANLKAIGIVPTLNPFCKFCGSYNVLGHGGACKPCFRKRHPPETP